MDWLARSPNMNPTEHVCDLLQRRYATTNVKCGSRERLEGELVDDLNMIPLVDIRKLI